MHKREHRPFGRRPNVRRIAIDVQPRLQGQTCADRVVDRGRTPGGPPSVRRHCKVKCVAELQQSLRQLPGDDGRRVWSRLATSGGGPRAAASRSANTTFSGAHVDVMQERAPCSQPTPTRTTRTASRAMNPKIKIISRSLKRQSPQNGRPGLRARALGKLRLICHGQSATPPLGPPGPSAPPPRPRPLGSLAPVDGRAPRPTRPRQRALRSAWGLSTRATAFVSAARGWPGDHVIVLLLRNGKLVSAGLTAANDVQSIGVRPRDPRASHWPHVREVVNALGLGHEERGPCIRV